MQNKAKQKSIRLKSSGFEDPCFACFVFRLYLERYITLPVCLRFSRVCRPCKTQPAQKAKRDSRLGFLTASACPATGHATSIVTAILRVQTRRCGCGGGQQQGRDAPRTGNMELSRDTARDLTARNCVVAFLRSDVLDSSYVDLKTTIQRTGLRGPPCQRRVDARRAEHRVRSAR